MQFSCAVWIGFRSFICYQVWVYECFAFDVLAWHGFDWNLLILQS